MYELQAIVIFAEKQKSAPVSVTKFLLHYLWEPVLNSEWLQCLGNFFYEELQHVKRLLQKLFSDQA